MSSREFLRTPIGIVVGAFTAGLILAVAFASFAQVAPGPPTDRTTAAGLTTVNTSLGTVNTSVGTVNTSIGTLTTLLGVSTPAGTNTVITPNDATVIACSAVWVGTGGNVYVRGLNDAACVGFLSVPDGSLLPVRAIRVCTTGPTTATNMVCLAP